MRNLRKLPLNTTKLEMSMDSWPYFLSLVGPSRTSASSKSSITCWPRLLSIVMKEPRKLSRHYWKAVKLMLASYWMKDWSTSHTCWLPNCMSLSQKILNSQRSKTISKTPRNSTISTSSSFLAIPSKTRNKLLPNNSKTKDSSLQHLLKLRKSSTIKQRMNCSSAMQSAKCHSKPYLGKL